MNSRIACCIAIPKGWSVVTYLVIGGTETNRVPVCVGDRSQKSNRTLAVQRRDDGDGDLVAGVEGVRSFVGPSEPEPRDLLDAAADERPLDYLAILVLDVDSHRRMGIDKPECLERPSHLRFFSQCIHTRKGM